MAKLKIPDEWWTAPAESDNGELILVTGRKVTDEIISSGIFMREASSPTVISSGIFNDRIEVTWSYTPADKGMPDDATSTLMEQVHEALAAEFKKDPVAIITGIYTGAGERNWVFYTRSTHIFNRKFNEILAPFPILPITIYAEKDPEWNEYREMRLTEISDDGGDDVSTL